MASASESSDKNKNAGTGNTSTAEGENLWNSILSEASQRSASDRMESRTVLVLGDKLSGKSSLLARLEGIDITDVSSGVALDYSFLDIKSVATDASGMEDEEPVSRMNLWQLEGETEHKDLLKFALNHETLEHSLVVITLDLSLPWGLVESLERWLKILEDHVEYLYKTSKNKILKEELQKGLIYQYQQYVEPSPNSASAPKVPKKKKPATIEDGMLLPLGQGVLTKNLGIPIVVVGCKSDLTVQLEKEYNYKEAHFDYISQYIRRICLKYGAAFIYTSAKKDINCNVLLDYLRYTLYNFDMSHPPQLLEKDQLFIPAGADSMSKIQVDFENQPLTKDPDEPFSDVIKIPKKFIVSNSVVVDPIIAAEDDQEFLLRFKDIIEKEKEAAKENPDSNKSSELAATSGAKDRDTVAPSPTSRSSTGVTISSQPQSPVQSIPSTSTGTSAPVRPPPPQSISTSTSSPKAANVDDHKVLASFFDSLIHREKPSAGGSTASTTAAAVPRKSTTADLSRGLSIPPHKGTTPASSSIPSLDKREDVAKELERLKSRVQNHS